MASWPIRRCVGQKVGPRVLPQDREGLWEQARDLVKPFIQKRLRLRFEGYFVDGEEGFQIAVADRQLSGRLTPVLPVRLAQTRVAQKTRERSRQVSSNQERPPAFEVQLPILPALGNWNLVR